MSPREPATKALYDARRSLLGWTLAVTVVGALYTAFWPTMESPQMRAALEAYPQEVLAAFNYTDLTSAVGYLNGAVYGLLVPLLVAIFAIGFGARAVAGDEEDGRLELILAQPVSRTRLALSRYAALLVALVGIVTLLGLALLALRGPVGLDGVSAGGLGAVSVRLGLFGAFFGALAFAAGAATGRRGTALGVGAAVAVAGYVANAVLPQVAALRWAQELSPFHWYLGDDPLANGLGGSGGWLLGGGAVALVALGVWAFRRRDVGA